MAIKYCKLFNIEKVKFKKLKFYNLIIYYNIIVLFKNFLIIL